ncbi:hypothetical protein BKH41_08910 [Helicobacter sp. 12S02232-10]|nr:hypothetical protein BKH41_08910 [Helicobacter sp. 12S02232-10]
MIFERLKRIIKDKELSVKFDEVLIQNDHCAEYFLLDLWEIYTQDINIGIGNLAVLAKEI